MKRGLTLVVMSVVAAALVSLSGGSFFVLSGQLGRAADAMLAARADAVIATLGVRSGKVVVLDTPADDVLDSGVWVFDAATRPIVRAPGSASIQASVRDLVTEGRDATAETVGPMRLLARHFQVAARTAGMVVVSLSLLPLLQTEHDALVAMGIFGALVLLLTLIGTRAFLHLALRPVAEMTARAHDWSEHAPERRFAMGPPHDELTALGATLDGLLARSAAALRYEQRLTAEIAHELRTPLARARVTAEVALRRRRSEAELHSALGEVDSEIRSTADALDALLASATRRHGQPHGTCDPRVAALEACDEARRLQGCRDDRAECVVGERRAARRLRRPPPHPNAGAAAGERRPCREDRGPHRVGLGSGDG